jgi:aminoglycoside phosphotransferase (APT) family kinase protein
MATRDLPAIAASLGRFLGERWDRPVEAVDLVETSVGARRGNILFDALDGERRHELVLTIYPPAGAVIFGVEAETGALRLAEEAGAPVAHVHEVCNDPSWFGEPFFVSTRMPGDSLPRNILRLVAQDPQLGPRIGAQLGAAFAAIHAVDAVDAPVELRRWPLDAVPSAASLELLQEEMDLLLQPSPALALGLRWLKENQPDPPSGQRLVHSDVRNGNILVDRSGLTAILDWEGCHTGDPHEDLAWLCVRTWRFGNDDLEVGGFSPRGPLVDAYRAAGAHFDPHAFAWWKVQGTVRWGLGLAKQARQHLDRTYRYIAMAGSGRRVCELEYDVLRLLSKLL